MIFHCGFDLHFLDDYQCRISFHLFVSLVYLPWENVHLGPMLILLLGCIIFYMLSLNRYLYFFDINLLWDISFANNFHSVGSIFILFFLLQLKDFSFIWFHLFIFTSVFQTDPKNNIKIFVKVYCLSTLFSRSFIISHLTVKFLIHFEFAFAYGMRKLSNLINLHEIFQFSKHHLLKKLSFPHLS